MKKYIFGLDNTLCITQGTNYENSKPVQENIDFVNYLKSQGHYVIIWTDREEKTGKVYSNFTFEQLESWGVKYDKIVLHKPIFDELYDCQARNLTINNTFYKNAIDEFSRNIL
jgi:protein tyrosine/serine phosphatase